MRRLNKSSPLVHARHGFTMIEVAIAIAVIAILAGMAAPLVVKALNQQREQKTRADIKTAWEALFGKPEKTIPNVISDFGWTPPAANGQSTLQFLTTRTPATLPNWGNTGPTAFLWGWNGPYWSGSITPQAGTNGLPADGWGNPFRLVMAGAGATRTAQLRSYGANARDDGGAQDDISYPSSPQLLSALQSPRIFLTVQVGQVLGSNFVPDAAPNPQVRYRIRYPMPGATAGPWAWVPTATTYTNNFPPNTVIAINPPYACWAELNVVVFNPGNPTVPFNETRVIQLTPGTQHNLSLIYRH